MGWGLNQRCHDSGENLNGDCTQGDPVNECGHDFQTVKAVGVTIVRWQAREAQGKVAKCKRQNIHEDVRRVGEQRETARPISTYDFDNEDGSGEQHGEDEAVFDGFVRVRVHAFFTFSLIKGPTNWCVGISMIGGWADIGGNCQRR